MENKRTAVRIYFLECEFFFEKITTSVANLT